MKKYLVLTAIILIVTYLLFGRDEESQNVSAVTVTNQTVKVLQDIKPKQPHVVSSEIQAKKASTAPVTKKYTCSTPYEGEDYEKEVQQIVTSLLQQDTPNSQKMVAIVGLKEDAKELVVFLEGKEKKSEQLST